MTIPEHEDYERPFVGCFKSLAIAVGVFVAVAVICLFALWTAGWGSS